MEIEVGRRLEQTVLCTLTRAALREYPVGQQLMGSPASLIVDSARLVTHVVFPSGERFVGGVSNIYLQPTRAWAADTAHQEELRGNNYGTRDLARKIVLLHMMGWDWSRIGGLLTDEQKKMHGNRLTQKLGWFYSPSRAEIMMCADAHRIARAHPSLELLFLNHEKINEIICVALKDLNCSSAIYTFGKGTTATILRSVQGGTSLRAELIKALLDNEECPSEGAAA